MFFGRSGDGNYMHVIHDDRGSDLSYVMATDLEGDTFKSLDYVLISQKDGKEWLGQVIEANRNLPAMGGDPLDPTILNGLRLSQQFDNIRSIQSVFIYKVLLLGQIEEEAVQSARIRPMPGSSVGFVDQYDLFRYLNIPCFNDDPERTNAIGFISNVNNCPLCLTPELFNGHIGVSGSTGCGKSNVGANLICQALNFGKCVIVHDVKPDYRYMNEPNTDPKSEKLWKKFEPLHLRSYGVEDVCSVGFYGKCDYLAVDVVMGFHASDFTPEELARLLFNEKTEQPQFEGFSDAMESKRRQVGDEAFFTLADVLEVVMRMGEDRIHERTKGAIQRKAPRRAPVWLDSIGRSFDVSGQPERVCVQSFDLHKIAAPGRAILLSYKADISAKDYAIVCSYFLRTVHKYCTDAKFAYGLGGMVQFIDEAHRIFDNDSIHKESLDTKFNRVMKEGRSMDHSIVLLLQNAEQIPDGVMNNINSMIVMRQNNRMIAKKATQAMGEDFDAKAMRLGTGQALVKLSESNSVLLAQMAPSPFELLRSDNRMRLAASTPLLSDVEIEL